MNDFILLMHDDVPASEETQSAALWPTYFAKLQKAGVFQGGSAIGSGLCARKRGEAPEITRHLAGFIRIKAESLEHARHLVAGNPVYESGGTVEVRELPKS